EPWRDGDAQESVGRAILRRHQQITLRTKRSKHQQCWRGGLFWRGFLRGGVMKLVLAIIKPHKLDDVRGTLDGISIQGLTVSEAQGYGRQKGHTEIYRGAEYETNLVPKMRIEVVVEDSFVERGVEASQPSARTGSIGDGKIFVLDVNQAVRIRTGEQNDDAL